jgi:hypothetical protein
VLDFSSIAFNVAWPENQANLTEKSKKTSVVVQLHLCHHSPSSDSNPRPANL